MKDWEKVLIFIRAAYGSQPIETLCYLVQMYNSVFGYDQEAIKALEKFTSLKNVSEALFKGYTKKV